MPRLPLRGKSRTRGVMLFWERRTSDWPRKKVGQRGQSELFRQNFRFTGRDKGWVIVIGTHHNHDSIFIDLYSALGNRLTSRVDIDFGSNRQIGPDSVLAVCSTSLWRRVWRGEIGDGFIIGCASDSDRCDSADGHSLLGLPLIIHQLK